MKHKLLIITIIILLAQLSTSTFAAFDPNTFNPKNAAHWYRKAFDTIPTPQIPTKPAEALAKAMSGDKDAIDPNEFQEMMEPFFNAWEPFDNMTDFIAGKIPSKDNEGFINTYKTEIGYIHKAAKIKLCDWEYNFDSNDPNVTSAIQSEYSTLVHAFELTVADALIDAEKGNIASAKDKFLSAFITVKRLNWFRTEPSWQHNSNFTIIFEGLFRLLPYIENDSNCLRRIKAKLNSIKVETPRAYTIFECETNLGIENLSKNDGLSPEQIKLFIKEPVDGYSISYSGKQTTTDIYKKFRKSIRKLLNLPYAQAYEEFEQIEKRFLNDTVFEKEDVINFNAATILHHIRSWHIIYYSYCEDKTMLHACQIAVDIALTKIRTGHYSDKLPDSASFDLISGQPFDYIKLENGFTLRSKVKDPIKREIRQWTVAAKDSK